MGQLQHHPKQKQRDEGKNSQGAFEVMASYRPHLASEKKKTISTLRAASTLAPSTHTHARARTRACSNRVEGFHPSASASSIFIDNHRAKSTPHHQHRSHHFSFCHHHLDIRSSRQYRDNNFYPTETTSFLQPTIQRHRQNGRWKGKVFRRQELWRKDLRRRGPQEAAEPLCPCWSPGERNCIMMFTCITVASKQL